MKININYIARVEGEGSVILELDSKKLKSLKLNIWEPPRFFEGFLYGRRFDEVPDIVARICGICPVSHMTTAIRAIEKALSIAPSDEVIKIRRLMSLSQIISSHLVHLYVLSLPDYYRVNSVIQMLPESKKTIERMLRMKEAFNSITAAFGGRALHPVSMVISGFTSTPSPDTVSTLIKQLEAIKEDAVETVKMVSELRFPDLMTNHAHVALSNPNEYAINKGEIVSNTGLSLQEEDYRFWFQEEEVPYSNAKRTVIKGVVSQSPGFVTPMVGALSRVSLNFERLNEDAKKVAGNMALNASEYNPFLNNLAQAVEIVHGVNECIELLDGLRLKDTLPLNIKVKEGQGSCLTEAPRGLLYHHYEINRKGLIEKADIVTPTAHNFLSLEENLKSLVKKYCDEPEEELKLKCEMLVRAYDPCFSCSVH